jgi:apolipoprotein D and lipocalin family protein
MLSAALALFLAATVGAPVAPDTIRVPVRPVASVDALDLDRYAGRWYEVAKFPNRFQAACADSTTAEYTRLDARTIRVVNRCRRADGSWMEAEGRARLADAEGPASRLEVRFAPAWLSFLPFVWGDYWVLDRTDDYRAALVGTPDRDYLWILARTPALDAATYDRLVATAAAQGFDVARIERAPR